MRIPKATYRIQFTSQFNFDNAKAIAAYLADLGISDLYASPIFKARSGSTHGYDVVDAAQLNPELGSTESFEALVSELQSLGMGWLQDIVPNHMAYSSENAYLMDVLEHASRFQLYRLLRFMLECTLWRSRTAHTRTFAGRLLWCFPRKGRHSIAI